MISAADTHGTVLEPTRSSCGIPAATTEGGHGAMVTTDVSCTLATNQDQVIFCRADSQANAETYRDLCPCLRARQYKDPHIVLMRGKEDER